MIDRQTDRQIHNELQEKKKGEVQIPVLIWMNFENMLSERSQHESQEASRIGKFLETESTLVAAQGWGRGPSGQGLTANGHRFLFWVAKMPQISGYDGAIL